MSVDFFVYLSREAMPTPKEWARALVERGFPAELDEDFDVDDFSGFLPCSFDGVEAGFEYTSGSPEALDELELPGDCDFQVTFSTDSEARDLASSVVCAAVLCALSGGVLVDPRADLAVTAEDAVPWARERLEEIEL